MTQTQSITREEWLNTAVEALRPLFAEAKDVFLGDARDPKNERNLPAVRVSVGWPSKGGLANGKRVIGQCWASRVAGDGVPQIFISPMLGGSPYEDMLLLSVLVHELIHAWDDCESGHRGRFARTARALGLVGKLTQTNPGDELVQRLTEIQREIGAYPHSALKPAEMEKQEPKQGTRMLKLECPEDGYIVRTTQKWLDVGTPSCPCGSQMELA